MLLYFVSQPDKTSPMIQNFDVLASLFCFKDVFNPLLVTNFSHPDQTDAYEVFGAECDSQGNLLIKESVYPEGDIENNMESYAELPCSHCEHDVIEIRRGTYLVFVKLFLA